MNLRSYALPFSLHHALTKTQGLRVCAPGCQSLSGTNLCAPELNHMEGHCTTEFYLKRAHLNTNLKDLSTPMILLEAGLPWKAVLRLEDLDNVYRAPKDFYFTHFRLQP